MVTQMEIDKLSLEQKIGQVLVAGFPTDDPDDPHLLEMMTKLKIGNVIYFSRNARSRDGIIKLNKRVQQYAIENSGIPAFITIDQEGGMVRHIYGGASILPGAMAVAATGNPDYARNIGHICGQELKALGINFNLAPVLDVNNNPSNPVIGVRSYSDNPETAADFACRYIEGIQAEGVIATGKHFPGHGDTAVDSHLDLPCVPHKLDRLQAVELHTFSQAVKAGIDAIMTTHILFPSIEPEHLPATLSKRILTGLLREQMEFDGLIITDCMEMNAIKNHYGTSKSAVAALAAGADLVIVSHTLKLQEESVKEIKEAIENGDLSMERLNDAVLRVLRMKHKAGLFEGCMPDEKRLKAVNWNENQRLADDISHRSITLVKDECSNLPLKQSNRNVFIGPESVILTGAENGGEKLNFAKAAAKYFGGRSITCSVQPDEEEIKEIVSSVNIGDTVVFASYNAGLHHGQGMLLRMLHEKLNNIVVVSLRNPYDYHACPSMNTYLCAYEYTSLSIKSLISVLSGELEPCGVLPVSMLL